MWTFRLFNSRCIFRSSEIIIVLNHTNILYLSTRVFELHRNFEFYLMGRGMIRDYFFSRSTMQLPSTKNNFRQHLLHHNTSFLAFSINELMSARAWDFCLTSMYEVILLMSNCWRFIVSKNRLQCNITKIPHGYWRQANLFVSITIRTDLPGILLPMRLRNDLSFSKKAIFHFVKKNGKISAQPYPTKCIQFLDREKKGKKQYVTIGKTDLFFNSMGLCGNFT